MQYLILRLGILFINSYKKNLIILLIHLHEKIHTIMPLVDGCYLASRSNRDFR